MIRFGRIRFGRQRFDQQVPDQSVTIGAATETEAAGAVSASVAPTPTPTPSHRGGGTTLRMRTEPHTPERRPTPAQRVPIAAAHCHERARMVRAELGDSEEELAIVRALLRI